MGVDRSVARNYSQQRKTCKVAAVERGPNKGPIVARSGLWVQPSKKV
jgi:hypothetical protein